MAKGAGVKFSAAVPKGDGWAIGSAVEEAVAEFMRTGRSPLIPCIAFVAIARNTTEPDKVQIPVVQLVRIESLDDDDAMRRGRDLIYQQWERRHRGQTMPLDLREQIDEAFPVDGAPPEPDDLITAARAAEAEQHAQIDAAEAEIDADLTDPQRLRRHLVAVHKWPADDPRLNEMPDHDIINAHRGEHEPGANPGMPEHDVDWWQWRRVDIEAAEATSDGEAVKA
jgi:hypothetical protein